MNRTSAWMALAALASLLAMPACESAAVGAKFNGSTGTVRVHLTDAPLDLATVSSVLVTLEGVTVYPSMLPEESETSPIAIMTDAVTFDLLTLTGGATELLAKADLPVGLYSRIRLLVTEASMTLTDGTEENLKISSQKVDIPIRFELRRDETTDVILDFQADASIQVNETAEEKFILRPVVTGVQP